MNEKADGEGGKASRWLHLPNGPLQSLRGPRVPT